MKNPTLAVTLLACCLLAQAAHAGGPEKSVEPIAGASIASPVNPAAAAGAGLAAPRAGPELREMPPGDAASFQILTESRIAEDAARAYMEAHPQEAAAAMRQILETGSKSEPAEILAAFRDRKGDVEARGSLASSFFRNARRSLSDLKDTALNRLYRDKRYVDNGSMVEVAHAVAGAGAKRQEMLLRRLERRPEMAEVLRANAVSSKDLSVRVASIETLAALKDKGSLALLSAKVAEKGGDSSAAAVALGRIGDPAAMNALTGALATSPSGSELESSAAEGLLRLGHPGSVARVSDVMDREVAEASAAGGWNAARVSKRALDLYHGGDEALQTNVERSILGMTREQPRAIMRRARKIIDEGGTPTFNATKLIGPGIVILVGLIFGIKADLIVGFAWLAARVMTGALFNTVRGGDNLEAAAGEILGSK